MQLVFRVVWSALTELFLNACKATPLLYTQGKKKTKKAYAASAK